MQSLSLDDAFRLAEGRPLANTYPAPVHYSQPGGPALPRTNLTVGDLLRASLDDIVLRTKASAHRSRTCQTNRLLREFGHLRADELQPEMVERYALQRKQQVSDAAVKMEVALVGRAYNLAIDRRLLLNNPVVAAKKRVKFKPHKRVQVLTPELEEQLRLAYLVLWGDEGKKLWRCERFALLTGLRVCEQAHLRPVHFQQAPGYVMVPAEGKTGTRPVPLCKEAREIAQDLLREAAEKGHKWLFWADLKGKSRGDAAAAHVRRRFNPACQTIGLSGYHRSRDLRRTFASRLIAAGVGIYQVQKLLGHTTTTTTQIYCQLATADLSASVAVFDQ